MASVSGVITIDDSSDDEVPDSEEEGSAKGRESHGRVGKRPREGSNGAKPLCHFGAECFRTGNTPEGREHLEKYSHPARTQGSSSSGNSSRAARAAPTSARTSARGSAGGGGGGGRAGDDASADVPVDRQPSFDGIGFKLLTSAWFVDKHAISMGEIVQTGALWVLMFNYHFGDDPNFLMRIMPALLSCPVGVFHGYRPEEAQNGVPPLVFHGVHKNIVEFPQKMSQYGTHHTKMWIVCYRTFLRLCISTANNIQDDFEKQTNAVWVQDFPHKQPGVAQSSEFETDLRSYLKHYDGWCIKKEGVVVNSDSIKSFDFSQARVRLVCSVPPLVRYARNCEDRVYGYRAMVKHLEKEEFPERMQRSNLTIQSTSYGGVNMKFWGRFVDALSTGMGPPRLSRVVYPSVKEVEGGYKAGGPDGQYYAGQCLVMRKNHYESFVSKMVKSDVKFKFCLWGLGGKGRRPHGQEEHGEKREKLMPHIKTFARFDEASKEMAWLMIGSHNLSRMAWGDSTSNASSLKIDNFEISVLFLPSLLPKGLGTVRFVPTVRQGRPYLRPGLHSVGESDTVLAFPIPFRLDAVEYSKEKGDEPWLLEVQRARDADKFKNLQQAGEHGDDEMTERVLLAMQASQEEARRKEEEDVERALKESMSGA